MQPRSRQRIIVDIPVRVTTVLDSQEGTIVDLSEEGALVAGCSLPERSHCQLDYEGHVVFATVQWSEEDRMGIRFPYDLNDGPLFDRLEVARAAPLTATYGQPAPGLRAIQAAAGFGRRTG